MKQYEKENESLVSFLDEASKDQLLRAHLRSPLKISHAGRQDKKKNRSLVSFLDEASKDQLLRAHLRSPLKISHAGRQDKKKNRSLVSFLDEGSKRQLLRDYLSETDIGRGTARYEQERVKEPSLSNFYGSSIRWILSAGDRDNKVIDLYHKHFTKNGAPLSPKEVLDTAKQWRKDHKKGIRSPIDGMLWASQRLKNVERHAKWWIRTKAKLPKAILEDLQNGKTQGLELREQLVQEMPGAAHKVASAIMLVNGYSELAIIDIHMARYLREMGHDIIPGDYKTQGGLHKGAYLKYEKVVQEYAKLLNLSPAQFHFAVWAKRSAVYNVKRK